MDTTHIVALIGGSEQNLKRRLQLLYHGGYLDRPRTQIAEMLHSPGSSPMVYGLGRKGAEVLRDHLGIDTGTADWSAKNRAIRQRFLLHTVMVAGIMTAFEVACREHGRIRLISWPEILKTKCPEPTKRMKHPQTWRVQVPHVGPIGVTPDKVFGLHYLDRTEGRNKAYFFLEADRGTMPISPRSREPKALQKSSILRKLLAYRETHRQGIHTRRFGMKNFRVVTVTTSAKRVANMVEVAKQLDGLQGIFLFAGHSFQGKERTLTLPWKTGRGESVVLGARV